MRTLTIHFLPGLQEVLRVRECYKSVLGLADGEHCVAKTSRGVVPSD